MQTILLKFGILEFYTLKFQNLDFTPKCFFFLFIIIIIFFFFLARAAILSISLLRVRDLNKKASLKKEIRVPFRALFFLGKWYGVATYFFIKKINK